MPFFDSCLQADFPVLAAGLRDGKIEPGDGRHQAGRPSPEVRPQQGRSPRSRPRPLSNRPQSHSGWSCPAQSIDRTDPTPVASAAGRLATTLRAEASLPRAGVDRPGRSMLLSLPRAVDRPDRASSLCKSANARRCTPRGSPLRADASERLRVASRGRSDPGARLQEQVRAPAIPVAAEQVGSVIVVNDELISFRPGQDRADAVVDISKLKTRSNPPAR